MVELIYHSKVNNRKRDLAILGEKNKLRKGARESV